MSDQFWHGGRRTKSATVRVCSALGEKCDPHTRLHVWRWKLLADQIHVDLVSSPLPHFTRLCCACHTFQMGPLVAPTCRQGAHGTQFYALPSLARTHLSLTVICHGGSFSTCRLYNDKLKKSPRDRWLGHRGLIDHRRRFIIGHHGYTTDFHKDVHMPMSMEVERKPAAISTGCCSHILDFDSVCSVTWWNVKGIWSLWSLSPSPTNRQ